MCKSRFFLIGIKVLICAKMDGITTQNINHNSNENNTNNNTDDRDL